MFHKTDLAVSFEWPWLYATTSNLCVDDPKYRGACLENIQVNEWQFKKKKKKDYRKI